MDSGSLIDRIRRGDNAELQKVYEMYRGEFMVWANKHFDLDFEECKEAYQLSMVQFYENVVSGKLQVFTSDPKTYIFGIGKNKIRELRELRLKQPEAGRFEAESTDERLSRESLLNKVEQALHQLGDPCQKLLELYYYKKMSLAEITLALEYKNTDTTKNLKYKCLNRLRKLFIGGN